jgi:hypothetical protein
MHKFTRKSISLLFAVASMTALAPAALAGGSSYSFDTYARSGLVRTGMIFRDAFRLNVQTYLNSDYFKINQIQPTAIKVSCEGDGALETAMLRSGDKYLAQTNFTASTIAPNWYGAVLKPQNLILDNNSVYNLSVDLKARVNSPGNQLMICQAKIIEHTQLWDGQPVKEFESGLLFDNQEQKALLSVTSSDKYYTGRSYRVPGEEGSMYLPKDLNISGKISKTATGTYQLTVSYSDWVTEGMYNVMIPYYNVSPVKFDITSPRFFSANYLTNYSSFLIQEMHLYSQPSATGTVGKITLKTS